MSRSFWIWVKRRPFLSFWRNLRRARRGREMALSIRAGTMTIESPRGCGIAETTKTGSTDGGYICISGGCPAPTATYSLGNPSRNASRLFRRRGVGMRLRSKITEKVFWCLAVGRARALQGVSLPPPPPPPWTPNHRHHQHPVAGHQSWRGQPVSCAPCCDLGTAEPVAQSDSRCLILLPVGGAVRACRGARVSRVLSVQFLIKKGLRNKDRRALTGSVETIEALNT